VSKQTNSSSGFFKKAINYQSVLLLVLFGLIIFFGMINSVFLKPKVIFNVIEIIGETLIMALPMTFIITTGGIDLSVGYTLTLSAIVFGATLTSTGSLALAITACILTGTAAGAFNGLIISRTRIPPLVCTLATMSLYRGIALIIAGDKTYTGFPDAFKLISTYRFGKIVPIQITYLAVFFIVFYILYNRSSLGRNLKAIGFNENAVKFAGVDTRKIKFWIYTASGTMSAMASLVYLGRLSAAKPSMGMDLNLEVITAVVLGGTSTMGGVGSMTGTLVGVLIIGVLRKGFTIMNLSGNIFNFVLGAILIVGLVAFSVIEERKKTAKKGQK